MKKWIICLIMMITLLAAGCPRHWARHPKSHPPGKVWVNGHHNNHGVWVPGHYK